jgi:hypothetical protein
MPVRKLNRLNPIVGLFLVPPTGLPFSHEAAVAPMPGRAMVGEAAISG